MYDSYCVSAFMYDSHCSLTTDFNNRTYGIDPCSVLSLHDLWHNRLGHLNLKVVSSFLKGLYPS